jgi:hypothetical protein
MYMNVGKYGVKNPSTNLVGFVPLGSASIQCVHKLDFYFKLTHRNIYKQLDTPVLGGRETLVRILCATHSVGDDCNNGRYAIGSRFSLVYVRFSYQHMVIVFMLSFDYIAFMPQILSTPILF